MSEKLRASEETMIKTEEMEAVGVKKATWGELRMYENFMPVLEIKVDDTVVGYLAPFRGYRFQVSGTFNGQGDYGSSEVVGLKNAIIKSTGSSDESWYYRSNCNAHNTSIEMLLGLATIAVAKFCRNRDYIMPDINLYCWRDEHVLNDFIEACYNMLDNNIYG